MDLSSIRIKPTFVICLGFILNNFLMFIGNYEIGSFKHLPPTLLAQYHFTGLQGYRPYVGVGINYTDISKVSLLGGAVTLDQDSWGGALQAGVDIALDRNWSINLDVKKVYIKTRVYSGGANAGTLRLDPVLAGVGIGYRF